MTTQTEALKLALESMKRIDAWLIQRGYTGLMPQEKEVITSIEAALAQPEQEPVAWATRMGEYAHIHWGAKRPEYPMVYEAPLYTTPPQCKPLTDEQKDILNFLFGLRAIDDVWFGDKHPTERGQYWWRNRLRKAFQEAAHGIKEKNT